MNATTSTQKAPEIDLVTKYRVDAERAKSQGDYELAFMLLDQANDLEQSSSNPSDT
jgi:hypothetical protein